MAYINNPLEAKRLFTITLQDHTLTTAASSIRPQPEADPA